MKTSGGGDSGTACMTPSCLHHHAAEYTAGRSPAADRPAPGKGAIPGMNLGKRPAGDGFIFPMISLSHLSFFRSSLPRAGSLMRINVTSQAAAAMAPENMTPDQTLFQSTEYPPAASVTSLPPLQSRSSRQRSRAAAPQTHAMVTLPMDTG